MSRCRNSDSSNSDSNNSNSINSDNINSDSNDSDDEGGGEELQKIEQDNIRLPKVAAVASSESPHHHGELNAEESGASEAAGAAGATEVGAAAGARLTRTLSFPDFGKQNAECVWLCPRRY